MARHKINEQIQNELSNKKIAFDINSPDFEITNNEVAEKAKTNGFLKFYETVKYRVNVRISKIRHYWVLHPLIGYSIKRILYGIITLILGIALLFLILRSVMNDNNFVPEAFWKLHPGITTDDPIYINYLNNRLKQLGLYGNIFEQMWRYLYNVTPFLPKTVTDFNGADVANTYTSFFYLGVVSSTSIATPGTSVWQIMKDAMVPSFFIGSIAVAFSYVIGIPLGIESARFRNRHPDSIINSISTILIAMPALVIVLLIFLFSSAFGGSILYVNGNFSTRFWPIVSIFLLLTPSVIIMTRRYVLDETTSDYTSLALAKGLTHRRIYYVHIFRNAGIRIIHAIPAMFVAAVFGLSLLTEKQWSIPGMSRLVVAATNPTSLDIMVLMGYTTIASFVTIFTALLSDLIISWLDPRVSISKNKA